MILVADSGSSKTDWRLIDIKEVKQFECKGLNPDFHTSKTIAEEVSPFFSQEIAEAVREIYFYGSGCSSPNRNLVVEKGLQKVFSNATIRIEHDLLGTARATCGNKEGLAGILGTGSNCCLFDGENITKEFRSGGYIISDEGGGVDIGKKILKAYIEDYLPEGLKIKFDFRYKLTVDDILENLYKKPLPNRFVASFAKFAFHHREDPFIADVIYSSFDRYFENKVMRFEAKGLTLNLVGSIAFYFQEYIRKIGVEKGISVGTILEKPIAGLTLYHSSLTD